MATERVGVVGFGQMGAGIAEVCARAGLDVVVTDSDAAALARGQARLESSLARAVGAGKLDEQGRDAALRRVRAVTGLEELADRDLVIEAAVEDEAVKCALFARLDEIVEDPQAVLASNTSTIPIVKMAMATRRPESVLGVHFFNPVPVMPLVELISSVRTAPATAERAEAFVTGPLEKSVIHAADRAGFIVNGLLIPYLLSAVRMLEGRFASAEDIDAGMVLGCNHPLGPLALCDFIGLDTVALCAESLYAEFRDPAFATPPLLARMVAGGLLGRKSGHGFFAYG
ncbi:MAG TPA: 3-hydroxybutyryl-CoA dehydrogenase [Acidimicrobiales bacterium]|nr:3-hydroxybutyryl-CoA dehydrogenase [Acidimicrobiales bacterium]